MKRTRVSSAVPLSQGTTSTTGTYASCAVLLGHGPSSVKGIRAQSAVPLSHVINSATGVRVSNVAPVNHVKGVCALHAAHPSHASRSNEAAATARRPPKRTCSPPPFSDHLVAVGLRCGKANTKTPRSCARLDPVFPRDNSGRSILFPIEEESTRLATSSPYSKTPNGKEPSRVGLALPRTRAPLLTTPTRSADPASSSHTVTHVHQTASVPAEQEEEPTLCDGPVMTPRPPSRTTGRYSRESTEESHVSSSRSRLEPLPIWAQLEQILAICRQRAKMKRDEKPWVRTRIVLPRPGVPGRGHCRPKLPRPCVSGRGYCRPKLQTRHPTD